MAAVNKNKLLDNATKYIQKGQIDRAIKELQKVIEADPADVRTRLKLGDLFAKKNQNAEAAEQYTLVAESYSKDGFYLKAVAVYKQILKLDSSLIDVHLKLGELYHQLGLISDAMSQFQIVAQHYDTKGMTKELLEVLRKMCELDPENVQSRKKLAEIVAREGNTNDAVSEFRKIADDLKAKGRLDDLVQVLERVVHLDASNLDTVRELAALYLERGDPKRALAKLQICFRADPHDIATLDMLSKAFIALGQPEKAKSVYRELAKIHEAAGNMNARNEAYRAVLQLDPGDPEARAQLEGGSVPGMPPGFEPSGGGSMGYGQPMSSMAPPPPVAPPPEPRRASHASSGMGGGMGGHPPPVDSSSDDPQTISKLLTEADVYLKYGLLEKALDHLRGIVRRNAGNVDAHMKLKDVYLQHKDLDGAVGEIVTVVDLLLQRGERGRAQEVLQTGFSFAPGHPGLVAKQGQLGGAPAPNIWQQSSGTAPIADPSSSAVEISIEPADAQEVVIEDLEPEPANEDNLEISVDQQVQVQSDPSVEIEVGELPPSEDSVDVSVMDAEQADSGDELMIEAEEEVVISDEPPAPPPVEARKASGAKVVPLDSRREAAGRAPSLLREKSQPLIVPEPAAVSPEQMLNEFQSALESTGRFDESSRSPSKSGRFESKAKAPPPPEVSPDPGEDALIDLGTDDRMAVDEAPAPPPKRAPTRPPPVTSLPPAGDGQVPPEAAEDVDEADFFVKQEIYDEAISVYKRLLRKFPGNPTITQRMKHAEALMSGEIQPVKQRTGAARVAPPPPAPVEAKAVPRREATPPPARAPAAARSAPAEESGGFDLAAELMSELDEIAEEEGGPSFDENEQVSVGDVLREFRKGVEKQVGTEDKEARYNLGLAYREMGLLDEAIAEFEIASKDAGRRADCLSLIGMCQRDKGDLDSAVKSFSDAIKTTSINDKQKASFFYELGATMEAKGDEAKALKAYQQVQALDPGFRDVVEKISSLSKKSDSGRGGGSGAPPSGKKISYL